MRFSTLLIACLHGFALSFQRNLVQPYRSSSRLFATTPEETRACLPSPLIDAEGNVIESAETIAGLVENQRVALYFGASWCRDCANLEFMLPQYMSALADSDQPIQLIYVPCDKSQDDQLKRMKELGIKLGVPLGESADALMRGCGVWPGADAEKFGDAATEPQRITNRDYQESDSEEKPDVERVPMVMNAESIRDETGRRSGIPAFVVLDNKGEEFCFLNAERDSISVLADWPLDDPKNIW